MAFPTTTSETFTADETRALTPYFTNADRPVFVLRNLPETVKGALFARYSRSAKSVRRLFLDEFLGEMIWRHAGLRLRARLDGVEHGGCHSTAGRRKHGPSVQRMDG